MKLEIRKLAKGDDRSGFHSGDIELDRFFIKYAGQNQFRYHIGTTYVAIEHSSRDIVGFITVANSSMNIEEIDEDLSSKFPRYPLPILRIARLGVDKKYQSLGVGSQLLRSALMLSLELSNIAGCIGVLVDAKDSAVGFYEKFGFEIIHLVSGNTPARPQQQAMFLSINTIKKALFISHCSFLISH